MFQQRPGKAVAAAVVTEKKTAKDHMRTHLHFSNCIHARNYVHLQSHSLMLDARRSLQLPLMREVSHLQKIRTLQDQSTSSSTPSPSASSYGGKAKSLLGDPHADAEALALQLSAKLATTAKVVTRDDGGFRVEILQQKVEEKEMTAEAAAHRGGSNGDLKRTIDAIVRKLDDPQEGRRSQTGLTYGDVRDRIRRLESVFEGLPQRGVTVTKPKTPERDAPSSEVHSTDRIFSDLQERRRKDSQNGGGIQGWQGEFHRREETVDRVMMGKNGTPSPLSRLLSNQSALSLLGMEEGHESEIVENFSQAGKGEVSSVQREMKHHQQTNSKTPVMIPRDSLHLREIKTSSSRKKTEGIVLRRSRNRKSSSSAARSVNLREPPLGVNDDELDVSELPRNAACGMPWDLSRDQKYKGKGFVELQRNNNGSLRNPSVGGSFRASWREAEMAEEEGLHLQSSMDSDATSLHLIVGQNIHDSDLARFRMESDATVPAREISQQFDECSDEPLQQPSVAASRHPSSHARSPLEMFDGHRNLSQKYRPKTFNDLVGQHLVVKALTTAIYKAKVAPVYLFMGPRGTGKTSAARIFASGLNCQSSDAKIRPCGICRECGTMSLNRSLDVKEIDAASKLDLASMRAGMGSLVPQARYKVIIVEACDMLSTEIWNAFLKVLEEPPRNVVFILITTDAERIPLTAISRCQRFLFYKLKEEEIVGRLRGIAGRENLDVEDGALSIIAAGADGSLRDAEMTLDQLILLDNNITLALVQELVGHFPDGKVMDLLDSALSADTVSTVRTMREILSSGVESMSLLSQLGALITDILVGSCDVHRDTRRGFFSRGLPAREEQRRLRHALKVLAEAEKQLRTSDTRPTWLTAALLQFAPDHSFLPSPAAQSPLGPGSLDPRGGTVDPCTPRGFTPGGPLVMGEQIHTEHFAEPALGRNLRTHSDSKRVVIPDVRNRGEETPVEGGFADTERKLEEAWTEEPQLNQAHEEDDHVTEEEEEVQAQKPLGFEDFEILTEQASSELWRRVAQELTSNFLKRLLQTQGRLVIAAVASDGSSAIVEVEFQSARYRQKAERSWRSICSAFQAVLRTPVELRISLPEDHCEDTLLSELAREMADETQAARAMDVEKEKERLEEEAHAAAYLREMRGAPMRSKRRRSRSTSQSHRQTAEAASSEAPDRELLPGSEMGSFSRPAPRRRRRRIARRPLLEGESSRSESSWTRSGSLGDISMDSALLPDSRVPVKSRKNSLDRMETAKEDGKRTQIKALLDESQGIEQDNLSSETRRRAPHESILCWRKQHSPLFGTTWRMAMVKGRRRAQGKAMFLKLVPCAKTDPPATLNVTTLNHAPLSPILENDSTTV